MSDRLAECVFMFIAIPSATGVLVNTRFRRIEFLELSTHLIGQLICTAALMWPVGSEAVFSGATALFATAIGRLSVVKQFRMIFTIEDSRIKGIMSRGVHCLQNMFPVGFR